MWEGNIIGATKALSFSRLRFATSFTCTVPPNSCSQQSLLCMYLYIHSFIHQMRLSPACAHACFFFNADLFLIISQLSCRRLNDALRRLLSLSTHRYTNTITISHTHTKKTLYDFANDQAQIARSHHSVVRHVAILQMPALALVVGCWLLIVAKQRTLT